MPIHKMRRNQLFLTSSHRFLKNLMTVMDPSRLEYKFGVHICVPPNCGDNTLGIIHEPQIKKYVT